MKAKLKVHELAKELGVEGGRLLEILQRLGIDVKTATSALGSEEVKTIREHFRKQRPLQKATQQAASTPKGSVTEKRVGSTVIRRRAKDQAPEPEVQDAPEKVDLQSPEPMVEVPNEPEPTETEVSAQEEVLEAEASPRGEEPVPMKEEVEPKVEKPAPKTELTPKVVVPPPRPRRVFPSIIKKTSTETHLSEKVGPKLEPRPPRPKPLQHQAPPPRTQPGARPMGPRPPGQQARPGVPGQPGQQQPLQQHGGFAPRRVKEVDVANQTEAQKEQARKKLEGAPTIFKKSDYLKREMVHATKKKKSVANRPAMKTMITTAAEHKRVVTMGEKISVGDLAKQLSIKAGALIGKLMNMGVTATINQSIDYDTASLVAQEYQHEVKQETFKEEEFVPQLQTEDKSAWKTRAPVVTIMGHVDHGKTSLLDAIRKTNVAKGEAGGITQHVGAYTVNVGTKGKVTFIDTPGHEAFTAMRARGAKVTDLVILVVSATDGVMPQTLESIAHAQAAKVPIIVAVNKIDLPDANPDRIKQTLAGHNLSPEEWGGDTLYVNVSAKTGKNLDVLLENILLQSEMLELRADWDTPARGAIIESRLDKARGPVCSLLIQQGTLKVGDIVVCGTATGKVRAMTDGFGKKVTEAHPSEPVEVLGFSGVPTVGDEFNVVADEKVAREISEGREDKARTAREDMVKPKLSLDEMMAVPDVDKELRVILKADVQGSVEALKGAFLKFPTDKVKLKMLHSATGGIVESDIMLASASRAIIYGFNVRPDVKAQKMAEKEKVAILTFSIIYDLLEDIRQRLEGLVDKVVKEKVIGRAEVRSVFNIPKVGTIAGSAVIDGKVTRGCFLRLLRDSRVVYEGKISSLKRFKEDVKEVNSGFECGIGIEGFNDLKQGDQFEAFLKEELSGTL